MAHDLKDYQGAKHAFLNDRELTYDAAAAAHSRRRVSAQSWWSQTVERDSPPRWFIHAAWLTYRAIYSVTCGRFGLWSATADGWGMLRLRTVGRRTGQ